MKKVLIYVLSVVSLLVLTNLSFAQTKLKFGHVDSNALLQMMPERLNAQKALETHAKQLEETLGMMKTEFEKKYTEYVSTADSLSPLIRQTKEAELGELQQRIQAFQQKAQQELVQKENELLKPIVEKARKAIEEVGTENGYLYVFDIGSGAILHHSSDSQDILPLVKAKLGIK